MSYCNECENHDACDTGCIKGAALRQSDKQGRIARPAISSGTIFEWGNAFAALELYADQLDRELAEMTADRDEEREARRNVDRDNMRLRALQPARGDAVLEEVLHRCANYHGDDALLDAPCVFCGYNGAGYWQSGSHSMSCRWHAVGGFDERRDALIRRADRTASGKGQG